MLLARICQPVGDGPFPVLLDLHGGAWTFKDRLANVAMAEAMARSGLLTVSIDLRLGGEAPYPASVQDANYGIRWLKMKAPEWNGDPSTWACLAVPAAAMWRVTRYATERSTLQRAAVGRLPGD